MEYQSDVSTIQVSTAQLKARLQYDHEFFIQFFMYEHLTVPVPFFHLNIFERMVDLDVKRYVCAVPRGHAKTTLAKLAVVWLFLFSKYEFIVYVSNTADIAVDAVNDIVDFFENENFIATFGHVHFRVKRDGEGYYQFVIGDKECTLRARGANQQMRGINVKHKRPQVAIVDDLEDLDNIATEALFTKLQAWFYRTFLKAMDQFDNKVVQIGNMISDRCILKKNIESPGWASTLYGALLSNGETLWADLWPIDKLTKDFLEYSNQGLSHLWFAEMMNQPMMAGNGLIRMEEIKYAPKAEPGGCEYGFITCDPAISSQAWANKSAIVAHGWVDGKWQVVDFMYEVGLDPLQLLSSIINMALKWNFNYVGIEAEAYQAALQSLFNYVCLRDGIEHLYCVKVMSGGRSKTSRIAAWASMIKQDLYCLTEGDFIATTQLLQYNPLKKENDDDLIDGAAYGVQMIENFLADIIEALTNAPEIHGQGVILTSYDVGRF